MPGRFPCGNYSKKRKTTASRIWSYSEIGGFYGVIPPICYDSCYTGNMTKCASRYLKEREQHEIQVLQDSGERTCCQYQDRQRDFQHVKSDGDEWGNGWRGRRPV